MTQPMFPHPSQFGQIDGLEPFEPVQLATDARKLIDAKIDAVAALTEAAAVRFRGTNASANEVLKFLETWRDAMTSL